MSHSRPPPHNRLSNKAFTLTEILVVIVILGILVTLLLPVVGKVQAAARSTKCVASLRQISVAHMLYINENNGELIYNNKGQFWYIAIEPYLQKMAQTNELPEGVMMCPEEDKLATSGTRGHYGKNQYLNAWNGAPGGWNNWRLQSIERPSELIVFADSIWRDLNVDGRSGFPGNIKPRHNGRANVAYLDGRVESVIPAELPMALNAPPWRPEP
jgi:general secretion pathway protein G